MIQGLQSAGLVNGKAFAVGFDGNTPNLKLIHSDGFEKATVGTSTMCIGYAAVDNLNRLFNGQKPLLGDAQGCANKLLIKSNVPASGPWWGDVDVRADYWKLWGISAPSNPTEPDAL
jgi:ABC-type sugar transport system substrate-binding protein